MMARNKVIEPLGDYKSDYEFWLDLGAEWDTARTSGTAASRNA